MNVGEIRVCLLYFLHCEECLCGEAYAESSETYELLSKYNTQSMWHPVNRLEAARIAE